RREESTTEGELDVVTHRAGVGRAVERLLAAEIEVSIFVDPNPLQIETSKLLGAQAVEIQTARYSEARTAEQRQNELQALTQAAAFARDHGLHIHMGHGLTYTNVQAVTRIPGVGEVNIGHSIMSRGGLVGMGRAVREMKEAIRGGEVVRW